MRDFEVFRLVCVTRLTEFNEICHNEGNGGWPNADQIWRCCVNIWGYMAQKYYRNNRFRRHDSRINVTFATAEGTEDHSIRCHCAVNKRPAGDALPSR